MTTKKLIRRYAHIFGTDFTQDANCKAAYLFKEGSGVIVDNAQGDATYDGNFKGVGEPAWKSESPDPPKAYTPYSVQFDGADDYINCGDLDISGNKISMVAWLYPHAKSKASSYRSILAKSLSYKINYEFALGTYTPQDSLFGLRYNNGGYFGGMSADELPLNTWSHAGVSWDGENVRTYLDGVLSDTDACSTYLNTWPGYADTLLIGKSADEYDGPLTEIGLFDRDLDSTEINAIMDYGLGPTANPYPTSALKKGFISAFHCFISAYIRAKVTSYDPLKLPDGTIF